MRVSLLYATRCTAGVVACKRHDVIRPGTTLREDRLDTQHKALHGRTVVEFIFQLEKKIRTFLIHIS